MKRNIIWLMTAVMVFTFIGLLFVQIMYMENMIKMRNEQFGEVVMRCMNNVSQRLEQDETRHYLDKDLIEAQSAMFPSKGLGNNNFNIPLSQQGTSSGNLLGTAPAGSAFSSLEAKDLKNFDSQFQSRQEILKNQYLYQKGVLNEVILNILVRAGDRPIEERADSALVRTYLRNELANNGLALPFEFAIVNNNDGVAYSTPGYTSTTQNANLYSQPLFTNDALGTRYTLRVTFPSKSDYIFSSIKFMLPSFAFTFILLFIFIYTIIVAFKQKKISEMKTEFINNMTHEFKTPISSISLAAQMLNDPAIRKSPTMLDQAVRVIGDETKRLRFQVEKVLQLSMFDRKTATMKLQETDANAVIDGVINTYKLKVKNFGGSLTGHLDAEDPIIAVDEMHFTNVIFNLLDNAIKYRKEDVAPELTVTTRNHGENRLIIEIADNGIGIKKDDLKRIFERFYRVSTGNRHDVKGFGLGLAYVSKMIDIFGGDIKAESEFGKGSKFIITLPLITG